MIEVRRSDLDFARVTIVRNFRDYHKHEEAGRPVWSASSERLSRSNHSRRDKRDNHSGSVVMALLVLLLIAINAAAYFWHSDALQNSAKEPGLKASVVETLDHLDDHRTRNDEPPVPFDRGVPDFTIR